MAIYLPVDRQTIVSIIKITFRKIIQMVYIFSENEKSNKVSIHSQGVTMCAGIGGNSYEK
jgi:hypothetical protein